MSKVFISHSWYDNDIAKKIAEYLKRDGAKIWIDYATIKSGAIPVRISQALEWCDTMVLIWSKAAADSYYVGLEWQSALDLQKSIIPCIIDDTERPAILRGFLYIDIRNFDRGYEQLFQALALKREKPVEQPSKPEEKIEEIRRHEKPKKTTIKSVEELVHRERIERKEKQAESPIQPVRIKKTSKKTNIVKIASLVVAIFIIGFIGIYVVIKMTSSGEIGNKKGEKVAEQKSEEDSLKTYWEKRQLEMDASYHKAQQNDKNASLTAKSKTQTWYEFLISFAAENPLSDEDDNQRADAITRRNYWQEKRGHDSLATIEKAKPPAEKTPTEKTVKDMKLVLIPGGTFQLGDTFGDGQSDEKPEHSVTVSDFYMSKTEVTVSQYRNFCQATGRNMPDAPSWGWQDNHPIVNVSWYDAVAFCQWAGTGCRLPTEAEWEYAARNSGKKVKYPNGNTLTPKDANYDPGNYTEDGYRYTSPVGSFPANKLGLYNMAGNVWEWCADWYDKDYYKNSPQNNPNGPSSGTSRVLRGGSWNKDEGHCRSSFREWGSPVDRGSNVGFRVVQDSPQ